MQEQSGTSRQAAQQKMESGGLMRIGEVAALLDVNASTIHKLPLPSIRLGRLLRFDPKDVSQLIAHSKEPVVS
ncbi:helix-turn-helix domain-containing protein [Glaciimonas sp. PAMC28666]|uniref:helix-turn-helix domain-containing protein n=1 Tax=Glaciimonas sp. PAMC28666 TaxID=2807626 RepID=UPI0019666D3F|nr:helix-turn-helix domain-containing protein [Glaciimonas sp. PAMC28666]QRX83260.1 helix-turn-helix domain-containing protein [Glaciimonas sp. PAMC28666]